MTATTQTALPQGLTTGTWALDTAHTEASFTARHAGVTKVRGTVKVTDGALVLGDTLETSTLTATLGTYSKTADNTKPNAPQQNDQAPTQSSVGLTLVPNGNGDGLLVQDVDQNSVAADKGFQVGDTILEVDNKKVTTGKDFEDAIAAVKSSGRNTALIKAERDGNVRFIGLPLTSSQG